MLWIIGFCHLSGKNNASTTQIEPRQFGGFPGPAVAFSDEVFTFCPVLLLTWLGGCLATIATIFHHHSIQLDLWNLLNQSLSIPHPRSPERCQHIHLQQTFHENQPKCQKSLPTHLACMEGWLMVHMTQSWSRKHAFAASIITSIGRELHILCQKPIRHQDTGNHGSLRHVRKIREGKSCFNL